MRKKETKFDPVRVLRERLQGGQVKKPRRGNIRKQFGVILCVGLFLLGANVFKESVFRDNVSLFWGTNRDFAMFYDEAGDDRLEWTDDEDNLMAFLIDFGSVGTFGTTGTIFVGNGQLSTEGAVDFIINPGGSDTSIVGTLDVSSTTVLRDNVTIGDNSDNDFSITFDGDTSNGILNYDEDNADFEFDQDIITSGILAANGGGVTISGPIPVLLLEDTTPARDFQIIVNNNVATFEERDTLSDLMTFDLLTFKTMVTNDLDVGGGDITTPGGVDLTIAPGGGDLQLDAQVGIGIADPAVELVVFATVPRIFCQTSGSGTSATDGFQIAMDASQNAFVWNYENAPTMFATDGDEHMRLFASGGLGIGNSTFPTDPGAGGLNTDGVARFGGGGATNYTQWAADGMQTMVGDARVHGHMNFPATRVKKGGVADPTEVILDGFNFVLSFDPATDKEVFGQAHIPSDYEMGTDLHLHFHWAPSDGNAGNVTWGVEWLITTDNVNDSIVTGEVTQIVVDATESLQDEHLLSDTITIDGTGVGKSDLMHFRVFRDANASEGGASDTYAADAYLINVSVEYIRNSQGEDGVW